MRISSAPVRGHIGRKGSWWSREGLSVRLGRYRDGDRGSRGADRWAGRGARGRTRGCAGARAMGKRPWVGWTRPIRRSECATAATPHQTIAARPAGRDSGGEALTVKPSTDPRDPRRTQRRHAGARHFRLRPQRVLGRGRGTHQAPPFHREPHRTPLHRVSRALLGLPLRRPDARLLLPPHQSKHDRDRLRRPRTPRRV